jgi:parallel beta-helix repeat protein
MSGRLFLVLGGIGLAGLAFANPRVAGGADSRPVFVVSQQGKGDFHGTDERPILAAIESAGKDGATIVIGPGEYCIRRRICPTSNVTIKAAEKTVLKLSSAVLVGEPARKGQSFVLVDDASPFAAHTTVELLPPTGAKTFPGESEEKFTREIERIEPGRLVLSEPLSIAVPANSRIGYAHNVFEMRGSQKNVRFESLTIDGGRKPDLPMPGHVQRCAILAHGRYSYEKGPSAPPLENLQVVNCRIRNCYGRAVAFYSVVKSKVTDCTIEDVSDEAIDFDHFCYHCEATGNRVKRSVIGVCLNDASYCTVRDNCIDDCVRSGIVIWWWYRCPMEGLNVENVIADNAIHSPGQAGISIGKRCFRNKVYGNYVEGGIRAVEPDNEIGENTLN